MILSVGVRRLLNIIIVLETMIESVYGAVMYAALYAGLRDAESASILEIFPVSVFKLIGIRKRVGR